MIPFYKQEKNWSCGAAAFRMVLESLGIVKSELKIRKLLGTNAKYGSRRSSFPLIAERYKLDYIVNRNSSFEELKFVYKKDYKIIVSYYLFTEKTGHFGIIEKLTSKYVYLIDPWNGRVRYSHNKFRRAWSTLDPKLTSKYKRWFFGVRN